MHLGSGRHPLKHALAAEISDTSPFPMSLTALINDPFIEDLPLASNSVDTTQTVVSIHSPLTDLSSDEDTLMDGGLSPARGELRPSFSSLPLPNRKRKRFVLDYVLVPPFPSLTPQRPPIGMRPEDPPPTNKRRLNQDVSSRRNPPRRQSARLDPLAQSRQIRARAFRDAATSPPPESPTVLDTLDTDLEHCLDSVLNQLAEETQRREALQRMYASGSYGVLTTQEVDPQVSSFDADFDTRPFLLPSEDASDDEISISLFGNAFQSLDIRDLQPESVVPTQDSPPAQEGNLLQFEIADDTRTEGEWLMTRPLPEESHGPDPRIPVPAAPYGISPHVLYCRDPTSSQIPEEIHSPAVLTAALVPMAVDIDDSTQRDAQHTGEPAGTSEDFAAQIVAPDVWWGAQNHHETVEAHTFDDGDSEDEMESTRSRCPCNQCSPNAPMHPDSQSTRHT
ncbi:hypothetical protein C8J57DRAFT_1339134, partial [Mycena rebaudengoi]